MRRHSIIALPPGINDSDDGDGDAGPQRAETIIRREIPGEQPQRPERRGSGPRHRSGPRHAGPPFLPPPPGSRDSVGTLTAERMRARAAAAAAAASAAAAADDGHPSDPAERERAAWSRLERAESEAPSGGPPPEASPSDTLGHSPTPAPPAGAPRAMHSTLTAAAAAAGLLHPPQSTSSEHTEPRPPAKKPSATPSFFTRTADGKAAQLPDLGYLPQMVLRRAASRKLDGAALPDAGASAHQSKSLVAGGNSEVVEPPDAPPRRRSSLRRDNKVGVEGGADDGPAHRHPSHGGPAAAGSTHTRFSRFNSAKGKLRRSSLRSLSLLRSAHSVRGAVRGLWQFLKGDHLEDRAFGLFLRRGQEDGEGEGEGEGGSEGSAHAGPPTGRWLGFEERRAAGRNREHSSCLPRGSATTTLTSPLAPMAPSGPPIQSTRSPPCASSGTASSSSSSHTPPSGRAFASLPHRCPSPPPRPPSANRPPTTH